MFIRPNTEFYMVNNISTPNKKKYFSEFMRIEAFLNIWILVEFIFKSLLLSIKCMPLHFRDL